MKTDEIQRQRVRDWWHKYGTQYKKQWRIEHREENLAHKAVANALYKGKMIRPNCCSSCYKECKPEAHHEDYSKRLEVKWLCKDCHEAIHHVT